VTLVLDNTVVYNGTINYTAVENSRIVSSNYGLLIIIKIHWKNGIFNSGW
jgi:hypothetical protein